MLGAQADHLQLDHGRLTDQRIGQGLEFAQRKRNIFQHAKGRKQRALLEQHANPAGRAFFAEFGGRFT